MLSLSSIFSSSDYADEGFDRPRWCSCGQYYTTLRRYGSEGRVREIILHTVQSENKTEHKTEVLVSVTQLTPPDSLPLIVDDYVLSPDRNNVLIFTESQKVWRLNTRGSYWVLTLGDSASNQSITQLGKSLSNPKSLMFATFSPNNSKVAYVFEHNIYVEDLETHQITQITTDGNENIINGTFDWVYEEEFHLRNGFRWSPDGQQIAYWQLDQSRVPVVHLINNTDQKYPALIPIHYPKTGDENSKVRIGVVNIFGGETSWLPIPSDGEGYHSNSNNYLADLTFHRSSGHLLVQQLNRLQNHLIVWSIDPSTNDIQNIFEDFDEAWIDIAHEIHWVNGGNSFLFVSDRHGWKQICVVDTCPSSREVLFLTPIGVDVESIQGTSENTVYYIASPDDPLRRYLYSVGLDGSMSRRVTPDSPDFVGTNSYNVSPNGRYAIHTFSAAHRPATYNIINLSDHEVIVKLASNELLLSRFKDIQVPPLEFFQVSQVLISKSYLLQIELESDPQTNASRLLDAYCLYPPQLLESMHGDPEGIPKHSFPVIFYVYGEPAAQVVGDHWMGKFGLWHRMLAQNGLHP
jgi:dipeptidyl-peptidase-4